MDIYIKELKTTLDFKTIYSIFKNEKNTSFLDSSLKDKSIGRYSFIGLNPFLNFKGYQNACIKNGDIYEGDIFKELNLILNKYKINNTTDIPFIGGGIGYFSYDLARNIEEIPSISKEDINVPYCYFNFYDNIIIYDNIKDKIFITACGILKNKKESITLIEEKIHNFKIKKQKHNYNSKASFTSNFSKENYLKSIKKVKEYIKDGHIYITNLTQRFQTKVKEDPFLIYEKLRDINPAPFSAYLNFDDFKVISSSPERFLKIEERKVQTRPIKGTRPRGYNKKEDEKNKNELINSEKDKAELLMIVDLERNDLSKVCKPYSVKVRELFKLEEYSTVFHLVSTIEGKLKDSVNSIDCIKECFPGGSITGAPKIRSMEIIDEIEKVRRNIYTGSIGYIGFEGNVDMNIVIRTILIKEGIAYFGVGGGITSDSDIHMEYDETLDKAKALMRVL